MSRHFKSIVVRSVGAWPLAVAGASLTLVSCAGPQQSAAALPRAPGTYVAVDNQVRSGFAATSQSGHFAEVARCLVFKPVGSRHSFTPIFPNGTSFVSDGGHTREMLVNGTGVRLDKSYRIEGQALHGSSVNIGGVPVGCPTDFYRVSRVRPDPGIFASLPRFCEGTMICRSFGLD
jgi:hypothetical protein